MRHVIGDKIVQLLCIAGSKLVGTSSDESFYISDSRRMLRTLGALVCFVQPLSKIGNRGVFLATQLVLEGVISNFVVVWKLFIKFVLLI